jgi:hypothetical protein
MLSRASVEFLAPPPPKKFQDNERVRAGVAIIRRKRGETRQFTRSRERASQRHNNLRTIFFTPKTRANAG